MKLIKRLGNLEDYIFHWFVTGNVLICDCKIAWLWTLRNETKNLKLREDLSELTCFFESQNVTQKLHNDAERIQALETARNPGTFHLYFYFHPSTLRATAMSFSFVCISRKLYLWSSQKPRRYHLHGWRHRLLRLYRWCGEQTPFSIEAT